MGVPVLTYWSEIGAMQKERKKKQDANIETTEIKFLRSLVGYTRKAQIRNVKIREYFNILNLNNEIINCIYIHSPTRLHGVVLN
jgi:hypothetical protein